jgi:hypothetical protein
MEHEAMAQRIETLAAAARIPLQKDASARIANAVSGALSRFHQAQLKLPLEIEPASFLVMQRMDVER